MPRRRRLMALGTVGAVAVAATDDGSGSWNLVYPRLLRAARRSPSFRARVHESALRVLALKRRLGLNATPKATRGQMREQHSAQVSV